MIKQNQSEQILTNTIDVYAIQNKVTGKLINYKNNTFYTTRAQAREIRRILKRKDIKIVKSTFVNVSSWETAK